MATRLRLKQITVVAWILSLIYPTNSYAGIDRETLEAWDNETAAQPQWDGKTKLPPKYNQILTNFCGNSQRDTVVHVPRDDVTYKAGVDSKGWFVSPADINEPLTINSFSIPITIPLTSQKDHLSTYNADLSETNIHAGTLTINNDGSVLFNGIPLNQNADAWNSVCDEDIK